MNTLKTNDCVIYTSELTKYTPAYRICSNCHLENFDSRYGISPKTSVSSLDPIEFFGVMGLIFHPEDLFNNVYMNSMRSRR